MLFNVCVFVVLLLIQITVSQVIYQDIRNTQSLPETTRRCIRQINNLPLPANGIPIGNMPLQNVPCANGLTNIESSMVQNLNSLPINLPTQNVNNLAVDRLMQNGNGINNNGLPFNNMAVGNNIPNFNNLNNLGASNSLSNLNNFPFGNGMSVSNNMPLNNVLPCGHNEQIINGFQSVNNIQNGFVNPGASNLLSNMNSVPFVNTVPNVNDIQSVNSVPLNLPGSYNIGKTNNFNLNNVMSNNNNMLKSNKISSAAQNNLAIANGLQNSFNLPGNNIHSNNNMFSNGFTNSLQNNMPMGNGFGNCLPNQSPISNSLPIGNGIQGVYDFQATNGIGNINNGLLIDGNNVPIMNNIPQGINDPFSITSNMPLHTIVPRNVINDNEPFCNNGLTPNQAFSAVDSTPVNGLQFNSWPRSDNIPFSNGFPTSNSFPFNNNMPTTNNMLFSNNWPSDAVTNFPNKLNIFQNRMPLENVGGLSNNFNFGKRLGSNNLQIEGFGNLPLLNGMPVTGITESVTLLNNPCR